MGNIGLGVACADELTGSGYMLYTKEKLKDRGINGNLGNADHFICAKYTSSSGWRACVAASPGIRPASFSRVRLLCQTTAKKQALCEYLGDA